VTTYSIVGDSTVTITSNFSLLKYRRLGIIGSAVITLTSNSVLTKGRQFPFLGSSVFTLTSASTFFKYRRFQANTSASVITLSSFGNMRKISLLIQKVITSRLFTCVITGSADSLPDLTVPISNMTIDHKALTTLSSISVTVPNGPLYNTGIVARKNGGILITATDVYNDGTSDSINFIEYPMEGLESHEGARNFSLSVRGSVLIPRVSVNAITITGISYRPVDISGNSRIRCSMYKDLLPGDVVTTIDNDEFTAGNIAMVIRTENMFMEITKDA
jgi:hypothetical protein